MMSATKKGKKAVTSEPVRDGQIYVQAYAGARRLTLDPLRETTLSIAAREVETTIPCGFQQEWASGETGTGKEFSLSTGAGVGSEWMTFTYDDRRFCVNARDIVNALMDFADTTHEEAVKAKAQAKAQAKA